MTIAEILSYDPISTLGLIFALMLASFMAGLKCGR